MKKPDKIEPFHYFDKCWQMNYHFCIGWSEDKIKDLIEEVTGFPCDVLLEGCSWCKDDDVIIWTRKKSGKDFYTILAHEIIHACTYTLDLRGMLITRKSDEALAYLHTCLMREALDA